jgi:hypothetical protein
MPAKDTVPWTFENGVTPNVTVGNPQEEESDNSATNDSDSKSALECSPRQPQGNRLLDIGCLASFLNDVIMCKKCCRGSFVLLEETYGLAMKLSLSCNYCNASHCIDSSKSVTKR